MQSFPFFTEFSKIYMNSFNLWLINVDSQETGRKEKPKISNWHNCTDVYNVSVSFDDTL